MIQERTTAQSGMFIRNSLPTVVQSLHTRLWAVNGVSGKWPARGPYDFEEGLPSVQLGNCAVTIAFRPDSQLLVNNPNWPVTRMQRALRSPFGLKVAGM